MNKLFIAPSTLYATSTFEEKYRNTYFSDCIHKDIFDENLRKHSIPGIGKMSYEDILNLNIEVMSDFIHLFLNTTDLISDELAFQMIRSFYIDPDSAAVRELGGIKCTADGLLSLNRIQKHIGVSPKMVIEYETYRKCPIIFFPEERNGINMTRAIVFGDRIDHTLFDLKNYYTNNEVYKLSSAYKLDKTSKWLKAMGSFENIVDALGLKDIFTNNKYEVFDLEKSDGSIITEYAPTYHYDWTSDYYENLKKKITEFMSKGSSSR